jgi:CheY-like chemotaxis protein
MAIPLKQILLIDDDSITNFLHRNVLEEANVAQHIDVAQTASEALELLECIGAEKCKAPELIFLDLNMPGLTGWDFIDEYKKTKDRYINESIIVILTTSVNPDDNKKAKGLREVAEFRKKPMTSDMVTEIVQKYFTS